TSPTCGDGTVQASCGEQCDDGNTTNGDGCSSTCQTEPSGPCAAAPLSTCKAILKPLAGKITLKKAIPGKGSNKLTWTWKNGQVTTAADFGAPLSTTAYHF